MENLISLAVIVALIVYIGPGNIFDLFLLLCILAIILNVIFGLPKALGELVHSLIAGMKEALRILRKEPRKPREETMAKNDESVSRKF